MPLSNPIFWGADGLPHEVPRCSCAELPRLQSLFRLLFQEIEAASEQLIYPNAESLYLHNLKVRSLCHEILQLNGLSIEWVNLDQLVGLCLIDGDQPPILAKLNGLVDENRPTKKDAETLTAMEALNRRLGQLLQIGISVGDAEHLLKTKSPEDIDQLVRGYNPEIDKRAREETNREEARGWLNQALGAIATPEQPGQPEQPAAPKPDPWREAIEQNMRGKTPKRGGLF